MKNERAYIQLNRTFLELPKTIDENERIDLSRMFGMRTSLSWDDILPEFRVIILAEAGAGKSTEIRQIAERLRNEGRAAFFLRLEHISSNFEIAFEVGTFEEFEAWRSSGAEAWLLLDSIDEAKLRDAGDFDLAVRTLGKRINADLQRVHIIITSRPPAWWTKTDLNQCMQWLPYAASAAANDEHHEQPLERSKQGLFPRVDAAQPAEKLTYKIVSLENITPNQVEIFAAAKNVENVRAFMDAVGRTDVWQFTTRPQDLEELIEFWNVAEQIGGRLEIMQNSIDRRLSERDPKRAEKNLLAPADIRKAVKLVAAAVALTKKSVICVPGSLNETAGIPISQLLPDWNEKDQAALLSRPVFDEAIYGTVRFHHRTVQEFLTAEWLEDLLGHETSRREIESLLFRNQYGREVVTPTMRPVLPWLAIFDSEYSTG